MTFIGYQDGEPIFDLKAWARRFWAEGDDGDNTLYCPSPFGTTGTAEHLSSTTHVEDNDDRTTIYIDPPNVPARPILPPPNRHQRRAAAARRRKSR